MQASIILEKSPSTNSLIYYRDLRNLNYIELGFRILYTLSNTNLSLDNLNGCLSSSLNSRATVKSHYFTLHTSSPWFSSHFSNLKRSLRKLERRIDESPLHKLNFLMARKAYKLELISLKCTYYEQKLNA